MHKIYVRNIFVILILGVSFGSNSQIISTFAGNGYGSYMIGGYSGDGGPATLAELGQPNDVEFDLVGNVYIADQQNARIRIINSSGIINTFAGVGVTGFVGDGGPATAAEFNLPTIVAYDSAQNMYVADFENNRIRKINTSGIITTIAGTGARGYTGNGGQATAATFQNPSCVITDDTGNIYVADVNNQAIRKINTSGIISTYAGNNSPGFSGDGGNALLAELYEPIRIAFDKQWNMYIADSYNDRIRMVNTSGIITTFAGNGSLSGGDGGPATSAGLDEPYGVCLDASGNVYAADTYNNKIREINTSGIISTIAGNGTGSYSGDGGAATAAEIYWPTGVSVDIHNNLYIDDQRNNRIRIMNLGTATSMNNVPNVPVEINVYPVPTSGIFTVSGISPGQIIELYNYLGQKVLSAVGHEPSVNFDISNQPNGIYLIRILNKDGSVVAEKKIVKTD